MDELNIEGIERCGSCGAALTAINISDNEPGWCQKCTDIAIEKLQPLDEDPEVKKMSDKYLAARASGQVPCYQDWDRILNEQGIEINPIRWYIPWY